MDNNGITPVMPIGGMGDGFGSGGFWIFALLILAFMGGGFGGFGGNAATAAATALGYENLATSAEVQRGFDAQNSLSNEREILGAVNAGTAQNIAAVNQTFHDNLMATQNLYNEVARDISNLQLGQANMAAQQQNCCCETKMLIQQTNYDAAMRDAATNANFTAQIQSVKDMMAQDKIEALQAQINALQMQNAMSGVLRFPNTWTYQAGTFPPLTGGTTTTPAFFGA